MREHITQKKIPTATIQQPLFSDETAPQNDVLPHRPSPYPDVPSVIRNSTKGQAIAPILYEAFRTTGIHGMRDMPEDEPPSGVTRGTPDHIIFLTLTVAIDYQRDAHALWDAARQTWEDPETRFLFDLTAVSEAPAEVVLPAMKKHRLSKKHTNDAKIWQTVAGSFARKWDGDPRQFLADCGWDAPTVLRRLKEDRHRSDVRVAKDFPFLGGNKIGPLWLRMLRDNACVTNLKNLDQVPIPVDVHIARASLSLGIVNGSYSGAMEPLFRQIRTAWAESVMGLTIDGRPMIALDVDEPLWHLSKFGCASRDPVTGACPLKDTCVVGKYCVAGEVKVQRDRVSMHTTTAGSRTLCVISCGGKKVWDDTGEQGPQLARDAYTGSYVRGNQEYAELFYPHSWCILSAKHGFLLPGDIVPENYNQRMGEPGSVRPAELIEQTEQKGLNGYDEIVVLAGREYVDAVKNAFPDREVRAVFEGVGGIGKQMRVVREAMRRGEVL